MPVVRLDGLLDLDVPRRRNAPCAFNYIIYPIFVQCYVMGRFGHENGPFWMLAGAVLVFFFLPLGPMVKEGETKTAPTKTVGAVLVCVGRFRPSLGPFWRWAVLVGSQFLYQMLRTA